MWHWETSHPLCSHIEVNLPLVFNVMSCVDEESEGRIHYCYIWCLSPINYSQFIGYINFCKVILFVSVGTRVSVFVCICQYVCRDLLFLCVWVCRFLFCVIMCMCVFVSVPLCVHFCMHVHVYTCVYLCIYVCPCLCGSCIWMPWKN